MAQLALYPTERTLECIFDLHRVTPPQSFAFKLTRTQGRFEDAKCAHLQALSPMLLRLPYNR